MRFREKYAWVEAREFVTNLDDGSHLNGLVAWIGVSASHDGTYLYIQGLVCEMRAEVGDWIIKRPFRIDARRFYTCKRAVFENLYEPVTS